MILSNIYDRDYLEKWLTAKNLFTISQKSLTINMFDVVLNTSLKVMTEFIVYKYSGDCGEK